MPSDKTDLDTLRRHERALDRRLREAVANYAQLGHALSLKQRSRDEVGALAWALDQCRKAIAEAERPSPYCSECGGTGWAGESRDMSACRDCNGTGKKP